MTLYSVPSGGKGKVREPHPDSRREQSLLSRGVLLCASPADCVGPTHAGFLPDCGCFLLARLIVQKYETARAREPDCAGRENRARGSDTGSGSGADCLRSRVVENLSQALLGPRRKLESEIVMCLVLCMTAIFH